MEKEIVFVDEGDNIIGSGTIDESRQKGIRHRISRVFLINSKGEVLIAKRAAHMRSQPGKWGESAAGHVDVGEGYLETILREMEEEIGVTGVALREAGKFYTERVEKGMILNRFNMLYTGTYDGDIRFNDEVSEVRWVPKQELGQWMKEKPDEFTHSAIKAFEFL